MAFQDLKHDPAWPWALFLAMIYMVYLLEMPGDMLLWEPAFFAGVIATIRAKPHVHATVLEAALPVAGRDLFLCRAVSLLILAWAPPLFTAVIALIVRGDRALALGLTQAAALTTLAVLLPQAIRVRQIAAPAWSSALSCGITAALGWLAWRSLSPGVFVTVFLLAGAALLIGTWLAVPPSLQLVASAGRRRQWITIPAWRQFPWLPVLSALPWLPVFEFAFLILFLFQWLFIMFFMATGAIECRQRTRWLYGLPVSHRALLNITLLAAVALPIAGLAIGLALKSGDTSTLHVGPNIPLEYWEWAPSGHVPETRAPWGETAKPVVFRALGLTFYNPYSSRSESTRRMLDWQREQAQRAVYGRPVPPAAMSWTADKEAERLRATAELIPNTERPRIRVLKAEAFALYLLLLTLATELYQWHRVRRHRVAVAAVLVLPLLTAYALEMYSMTVWNVQLLRGLLHFALLHLDNAMPNPVLAAAVAALPLLATYWLLDRQFRKSEVRAPQDPVQAA